MNALDLLEGACCSIECKYADIEPFLSALEPIFSNFPGNLEGAEDAVAMLEEKTHTLKRLLSVEEGSLLELALVDAQAGLNHLRSASEVRMLFEVDGVEGALEGARDEAVTQMARLGIELTPPDVFVVDEFPSPYSEATFKALAVDQGDFDEHGIDPGLYFIRRHFRPVYSRFLMCHELIHSALGPKDPLEMGRGLEEGLAEVVGGLLLSRTLLGERATENIFIQTRLRNKYEKRRELYLDTTRAVAAIYFRSGLAGLLSLLTDGRPSIKRMEFACLTGSIENIVLPQGSWDNWLTSVLTRTCLLYPRTLVVTPFARSVLPHATVGATVGEIARLLMVSVADVKKGLEELQFGINALVMSSDGSVVSWSDAALLFESGAVRYDAKPGSDALRKQLSDSLLD